MASRHVGRIIYDGTRRGEVIEAHTDHDGTLWAWVQWADDGDITDVEIPICDDDVASLTGADPHLAKAR